ncbi:MAG: deoxyhypusine synthase family protein [Acidobacteriia bacterium]|nr:deoxyhypusine synthase family protein [Terriglobia bacterium]
MSDFLKKHAPTNPLAIDQDGSVSGLLEKMRSISFQGRNLGNAYDVWKSMLEDKTTIMMGMAGAMSAGGMRRLVTYMIQHRMIDVLCSTGANFFHDIYESIGHFHYIGSPHADDTHLVDEMVDRVYDTYADEREFRLLDDYIGDFTGRLDQSRGYTTREFLYLLGQEVSKIAKEDGIVTSAYKHNVPLYCPAVADSSIGIGVAESRYRGKNKFLFDVAQDVVETARIAAESPVTGVIYFGGGTPKNFIQQTQVTALIMSEAVPGHKYAIQVCVDMPQWGGLSGCTFEEAQSWGKIAKDARMVMVHCDATIGMPMLVTGLAHQCKETLQKRRRPSFKMDQDLKMSFAN